MHKKTHYAKVDEAKCCNEAMAHKNNISFASPESFPGL